MTNYNKSRQAFIKQCEPLLKQLNKQIDTIEYQNIPQELIKINYHYSDTSDYIDIEYCDTLYDVIVELFTAMKYRK